MNPRRVAVLTRRIVEQFRRDRRTLALLFVAPVAIIALLGWVLRDQQATATRVVFTSADAAFTQVALPRIADRFRADGLVVLANAPDDAAARRLLADDQADVAVEVPAGFMQSALAGQPAALTVVAPGLNSTSDGSHLAAVQRSLSTAVAALAPSAPPAADIQRATVFGSPGADQLDTISPVFVGYFAYFFVFILTGISFLRERVGGTLERLMATPVTKAEIVLGYSLGFGIFATLQVALLLLFTLMRVDVPSIGPLPSFSIGLHVPSAGSPGVAYLVALVLGLGAVSLGIFISTFTRSEFQVLQFIPIVIVPQGLLGGIFWPIDSLPTLLQPVARILPVTYAVDGLRRVLIGGAGLGSATVQLDLVVLLLIAAFFVVLAAATIRREVA